MKTSQVIVGLVVAGVASVMLGHPIMAVVIVLGSVIYGCLAASVQGA